MSASDCLECAAAASDRLHAIYRSGCDGCKARAMARSPLYFAARCSGKQFAEYRQALQAAGLTHEQVRAAARIDEEAPCSMP